MLSAGIAMIQYNSDPNPPERKLAVGVLTYRQPSSLLNKIRLMRGLTAYGVPSNLEIALINTYTFRLSCV